MRTVMILVMAMAVLAACSPVGGGESAEPAAAEAGATTAPALNQVPSAPDDDGDTSVSSYPDAATTGDNAYPAAEDAALAAALPEGYPLEEVPVPADSVDLDELTPARTPATATRRVAPAPGKPDQTRSPQLSRLLEAALLDAYAQSGIPVDLVTISSIEPITWPDTSLGCPEPGKAYAEVMVEGHLITLEAENVLYTYHTSADEYVLCQDGVVVSQATVLQR